MTRICPVVCLACAVSAAVVTVAVGVGADFSCFWAAARLALEGRPEAAFDLPPGTLPWFYPPTFLMVVAPFGLLPYGLGFLAFALGTATLFALLLWSEFSRRTAALVLLSPACVINLLTGQNAFLIAALAGFALVMLDRRPLLAGALIGLLSIKPHLAILFPVALLAEGRWRTIFAAAATSAAFLLASILAFGWQSLTAFVAHMPAAISILDGKGTALTASVHGLALSIGVPASAAAALQAMAALGAAVCVWQVWRSAAPSRIKAATLVTASLMISPHLYLYDLVWLTLAVVWLARGSGGAGINSNLAKTAWAAPAVTPWIYIATSVQPAAVAIIGVLIAVVRIARQQRAADLNSAT